MGSPALLVIRQWLSSVSCAPAAGGGYADRFGHPRHFQGSVTQNGTRRARSAGSLLRHPGQADLKIRAQPGMLSARPGH